MGFLKAGFGFVIADHGGLFSLILFAVKEFTLDEKRYVLANMKFSHNADEKEREIFTDEEMEYEDEFHEMLNELYDFSGFMSEATDIVFHDDIGYDKKHPDKLFFKKNKNVQISDIGGCALMVCVAEYSMNGSSTPANLDDDDVLDLLAWKKILIDQKRIDTKSDAKLQIVANCCS